MTSAVTQEQAALKVGDRVADRDGYEGTIIETPKWTGAVVVRFGRAGPAMRDRQDLSRR